MGEGEEAGGLGDVYKRRVLAGDERWQVGGAFFFRSVFFFKTGVLGGV